MPAYQVLLPKGSFPFLRGEGAGEGRRCCNWDVKWVNKLINGKDSTILSQPRALKPLLILLILFFSVQKNHDVKEMRQGKLCLWMISAMVLPCCPLLLLLLVVISWYWHLQNTAWPLQPWAINYNWCCTFTNVLQWPLTVPSLSCSS